MLMRFFREFLLLSHYADAIIEGTAVLPHEAEGCRCEASFNKNAM